MKMNIIKQEDSGIIHVADITIAHLSRGLYRSNATAFKELVSNSFDALATEVRIDTNYPEFDYISCVDNGIGMSLKQFKRFFSEEGIGSCIKRKYHKDTINGRPIIGRLGIGMLAIGQLCHSFQIESHYKDENGKGKAYWAAINLLDEDIPDKEKIIRNNNIEKKEIEIGKWKYKLINYDETKKGFRIYSSDVRRTFINEMKDSINKHMSKKDREKISFEQLNLHLQFYKKSRSVRECKPYLETIWELAILCPIAYYGKIEEYPINLSSFTSKQTNSNEFKRAIQFIKERQSKFLNYNFKVIFDGIELQRLIQFPTEKETITKLYFIEFDEKVFEKRLKFSGYLFAQIPNAIKPLELNGVQIRLREVGIGGYDSTFLKYYKQIETIRSRWVSGEIFVDEGLEQALNIDRDSFNEHDEHYKKLQYYIHEKLNDVFDEIDKIARVRSDKIRALKEEKLKNSMEEIIVKESKGKFKLIQQDLGENDTIITVNENEGEIILNTFAHPLKKKKANMIIRAVELAYQIAKHTAKKDEERDKMFSKLIKEIFAELI